MSNLVPAFGGHPGLPWQGLQVPQKLGGGSSVRYSLPGKTHTETQPCARLQGLDLIGMLVGVLLIFAITLINGHGRIFWEDETLGWVLLRDPSWHHMLRAWKLGADGGGILFYVFGRAWFHVFGDSVLAFRLFTATTFGMAVPVLWVALRRFYPIGVVAFALFNTLFFSPPLTMHYMEGRFYGLLMLGAALALANVLALDRFTGPVPRRWYLYAFMAHLLLTGSHVLGVVYSAFFLLALVVLDRIRGRRRVGLYAASSAPWLLLLFERTAMQATARVGRPHFWTTAPHAGQVLGAYSVFSPEIFTVLLVLILSAVASLPHRPDQIRKVLSSSLEARLGLFIVAGCILLVPLGFLLEGMVGTWLFTDRYLQPVALGVACVTAELAWSSTQDLRSRVRQQREVQTQRRSASILVVAFAVALVFWVFRHEAEYTPSVPDFTALLTAHVPEGLPVVVEDAFTFTELMSRPAGSQRPYTFLLDWTYATSSEAPRMEVTQHNLMQNWKEAGYFAQNIQPREDFERAHPTFLIVSNSILGGSATGRPEVGNPLAHQFASKPGYRVKRLFTLDRVNHDSQRDTVWLVSRTGQGMDELPGEPLHCIMTTHGTVCDRGGL